MLTTLIAAAALKAPGDGVAGALAAFKRPQAPKQLDNWRHIDDYLAQVERYEERCKAAGLWDEEKDEWAEEQEEFFGMRSYMLRMRAWPNATIDSARVRKAMKQRDAMEPMATPAYPGTAWTFFGPRALEASNGVSGLVGGRCNDVAISPQNSNTWWIVGATGGPAKTTNGGAGFTIYGGDWPYTYASSVEIDPTNENRVYVASGDYPGWWGYGVGLFRTQDGGSSWTNPLDADDLKGCEVSDVLVCPDAPNVVLAAVGRGTMDAAGCGLWKSTNYGQTWNRIVSSTGSGFTTLRAGISGSGKRWIYATNSATHDVLRSDDNFTSWNTLKNLSYDNGILTVATSTTARDTVYVVQTNAHRILRSTDNGTNWSALSTSGIEWGQEDYNYAFECVNTVANGTGEDILMLGMVELYAKKASNSGWTRISRPADTRLIHVDYHNIEPHPTLKNSCLIANDGGIYFGTYLGAVGWGFSDQNQSIRFTEHVNAAYHPSASTYPNYCLTGIWHNGVAHCTVDPQNWAQRSGGDGAYSIIDDQAPGTQQTTWQNFGLDKDNRTYRIQVTRDGWGNSGTLTPAWFNSEDTAFMGPMTDIPGKRESFYFGGEYLHRVYRHQSSGLWLYDMNYGRTHLASDAGEVITAIGTYVSATDGAYVGTSDGKFYSATDPSAGFTFIDTFDTAIRCIDVNPYLPSAVLVCTGNNLAPGAGGGIWETIAANSVNPTWHDRSGAGGSNPLPEIGVNWVARDPYNPVSEWYAATDIGVFYTPDRGANWYNATNPLGLPNALVSHVGVSDGYLYAATFGRGMWRMPLRTTKPRVTAATFSSAEVTGGKTANLLVTLDTPAGPGLEISVSSNSQAAIKNQSIPFPVGQTQATLFVQTEQTSADINTTVTATSNGGSAQDSIIVRKISVTALELQDVTGGNSYQALVRIDRGAPPAGAVVNLADNSPFVTTPQQVTIPSGALAAYFTVTTSKVPQNTLAGIQASRPGSGIQSSFTLYSVNLIRIQIVPTSVYNTEDFAVRVTLNRAAPTGGFTLSPLSGNSSLAQLPPSFVVPEGASGADIVGTTSYTASDQTVGIRVTDPWASFFESSLTLLNLDITGLSYNPNPVVAGNDTVGTVRINRNPIRNVTLRLVSSDPSILSLPATVTILRGTGQATFTGSTDVRLNGKKTVKTLAVFNQADTRQQPRREEEVDVIGSPVTVVPDAFQVLLGKTSAGNLTSLAATDGNTLRVCKFLVPNLVVPPIQVQIEGTAPLPFISDLKLQATARMVHVGSFLQTLELWNWTTNNWDTVDKRTDTVTTTMATRELATSGNKLRYVQSGTLKMRARYSVKQSGPSSVTLWCHEADRTAWVYSF
ncbi:MAG: hypothetical protein KIT11_02930 [Fimbriimonadaceae bacterium]|nr:hypothetical protein [Fimbriimonadaceae bacterium]QYK54678.1 MAG: hypothetical protein KF733_06595 [Fimbriimonadaceae bacterium]